MMMNALWSCPQSVAFLVSLCLLSQEKQKKKNKRLILPVDGVPRRGPPELTLPPLRDAERRSRPETWPQYTQSGTHVRSYSFYVTIML